jgi:tryptophan-rich sensory protein
VIAFEQLQARERRRAILRIVLVATGLVAVYAVLPLQSERWWLGLVIGFLAVVAIVPVTVRRINAISSSSQPLFAAAEAIVIVVAMLIFAFSTVYLAIDRNGGQFAELDTKVDAAYFTVTTLSTVGYGDVHAAGQMARLAVTFQIIVDLSVIAISVRLIVGAARRRTRYGEAP